MIKKVFVFAVILMLLQSCSKMKTENPIVIGHRGAKGHVIENSLPSIQKGIDLGADAIEVDVFKIADGSIVVFHDDTVDRLTDGNGPIEKYTKANLDTLSLEGGIKIPTLAEALDVIDKKAVINIELKGSGTAEPVYQIVQQYIKEKGWSINDFIISSFKWEELEKMRALDAQIPIGILTSGDLNKAIAEGEKLQAVAIHPDHTILDQQNVDQMHAKGFKIYPWTVNDSLAITQMKDFKVDGIITDYPERVK